MKKKQNSTDLRVDFDFDYGHDYYVYLNYFYFAEGLDEIDLVDEIEDVEGA